MWTLSAEALLALNDVGAVPWVPLAQTALPPEELLRRCRERIEQQGKPQEQEPLRTVTKVLATLRYNDPGLLALLGGRPMPFLSEIPYVQELIKVALDERSRDEFQAAILEFLQRRFTDVPDEVIAKVRAIQDVPLLRKLNLEAGICPTLDAFRAQLPS